jgi:hypothetical protein
LSANLLVWFKCLIYYFNIFNKMVSSMAIAPSSIPSVQDNPTQKGKSNNLPINRSGNSHKIASRQNTDIKKTPQELIDKGEKWLKKNEGKKYTIVDRLNRNYQSGLTALENGMQELPTRSIKTDQALIIDQGNQRYSNTRHMERVRQLGQAKDFLSQSMVENEVRALKTIEAGKQVVANVKGTAANALPGALSLVQKKLVASLQKRHQEMSADRGGLQATLEMIGNGALIAHAGWTMRKSLLSSRATLPSRAKHLRSEAGRSHIDMSGFDSKYPVTIDIKSVRLNANLSSFSRRLPSPSAPAFNGVRWQGRTQIVPFRGYSLAPAGLAVPLRPPRDS